MIMTKTNASLYSLSILVHTTNFQMANGNAEKIENNWSLKITALLVLNANLFVIQVTKLLKMVA